MTDQTAELKKKISVQQGKTNQAEETDSTGQFKVKNLCSHPGGKKLLAFALHCSRKLVHLLSGRQNLALIGQSPPLALLGPPGPAALNSDANPPF